MSRRFYRFGKAVSTVAVAGLLGGAALLPAQAQSTGFTTKQQALARAVGTGVTVKPILSTGDALPNGYVMAGIPDGLGAFDNGDGSLTLYMNHELSARNNTNLTDARISKLQIKKDTLEVMDGKYVVTGIEGYRRFCSATMVGPKEGFDKHYYLTGEEDLSGKYGGLAVVIDTSNEVVTQLVYAGRYAWENLIAVPGFKGKTVMMGFDDTTPGGIYMYVGNSANDFWMGKADMYVFVADGGARTEDKVSKSVPLTGKFVPIDKAKASASNAGLKAEAEAASFFRFARPEDGTYDLKDPTTVYFNVTGTSNFTNTITSAPYNARGRTYSMKLDPADPTKVTALKVLLDGNAGDEIISPDNIAASDTHLMILEDINSEFTGQRAGRAYTYELATGKLTTVAELTHRDYSGQTVPNDKLGEWEMSGVINASALLGKDTWLLDVQAHTYKVSQFSGQDEAGQLLAITVPGSAALPQAVTPTPSQIAQPTRTAQPTQQPTSIPTVQPAPEMPTVELVSTPVSVPTEPASGGPVPAGMPSTGGSQSDLWMYFTSLIGAALVASGLTARRIIGKSR